MHEIFLRVANTTKFEGDQFPMRVLMSTSLHFELIDGVVGGGGGELGMAHLGAQGNICDALTDSGLATLGSWIVTLVIAAVHAGLDRDFVQQWKDS
jgi:uncharacterized membrane protein YjdF